MTETAKKHVEKAWLVKGISQRGKLSFVGKRCSTRSAARAILGQTTRNEYYAVLSIVRVEIREL